MEAAANLFGRHLLGAARFLAVTGNPQSQNVVEMKKQRNRWCDQGFLCFSVGGSGFVGEEMVEEVFAGVGCAFALIINNTYHVKFAVGELFSAQFTNLF